MGAAPFRVLHELRRRRVFRAAGVYIVATFAALQGASVVVPALGLPDWTMTLLVVLACAAFPVAMGLAWVFDVVPDGTRKLQVQKTDELAVPKRLLPRAAPVLAPCVAVVPFRNLSAEPDNEIFVDGITEDVITQLSKIRALKVIARASVMPFKQREQPLREMAEQLGATALLDGSVRRIGEQVRIVARLVDAQTEQQLWAETYDRRLTDIFAIQTDVALQIAAALEAELTVDEQSRIRQEPTHSIVAYQLYLKGRHWLLRFTPSGFQRAIEFFTRAIAEDPGYALAHVGVAMAYGELVEGGAIMPELGQARALQAAERALELDPQLSEAHMTRAHLKSMWEFDWVGAEAGFRRAIALNPSNADAHDLFGRLCSAQQRYNDALALQRRARELDPLAHRLDVATTLLRAGRYGEAEADAARAVEFEPDNARGLATLGWAQLKQGNRAAGLANLERAVALAPEDTQWLAQLGQARALAGDADGARDILRQLDERARAGYVTPYHLAFVYTGLGEYDRALDLLEQTLAERGGAVYGVQGSFLFASLREHPRFKQLVARMQATGGIALGGS